jgi:hypothetical protein
LSNFAPTGKRANNSMERFILAPEAVRDLQDIWDFIAADNP